MNNNGIWENLSMKLIASHCMQQNESQGIIANLKHSNSTLIYARNARIDIAIQATLVVCKCSQHKHNFLRRVLQIKFTALLALIIISVK